jgi:hypothetical protein
VHEVHGFLLGQVQASIEGGHRRESKEEETTDMPKDGTEVSDCLRRRNVVRRHGLFRRIDIPTS